MGCRDSVGLFFYFVEFRRLRCTRSCLESIAIVVLLATPALWHCLCIVRSPLPVFPVEMEVALSVEPRVNCSIDVDSSTLFFGLHLEVVP